LGVKLMKAYLSVFALSAILIASIGMTPAFGQSSVVVTTDKASYFIIILRVSNEFSVIRAYAQIEQLRADVQKVDIKEREDVTGQVTEINQLIVVNKRYREIPIIGMLMIPSKWEDIETIEID